MTSHIRYPITTENTPSHTPHKKATGEVRFLSPHQHKMATTKDSNTGYYLDCHKSYIFILRNQLKVQFFLFNMLVETIQIKKTVFECLSTFLKKKWLATSEGAGASSQTSQTFICL